MKSGYEKKFNEGDIVYWCHHGGNANYSVHWGMVDTQFHDVVYVDYLELKEKRLVDGIPMEDFVSEDKFRKLPKGWSYNTKLFDITYRDSPSYEEGKNLKINNPEDIRYAYDIGLLVKSETIFHGNIEAEITKEGFRIRKVYPAYSYHVPSASIEPYKLYSTYKEAQKEVDENIAEFNRQAALSDYNWSVEQIDKTLNRWKHIYDISDVEKNQYRDWILRRKNVEDIETRLYQGHIQWKYEKNKCWNYIEL